MFHGKFNQLNTVSYFEPTKIFREIRRRIDQTVHGGERPDLWGDIFSPTHQTILHPPHTLHAHSIHASSAHDRFTHCDGHKIFREIRRRMMEWTNFFQHPPSQIAERPDLPTLGEPFDFGGPEMAISRPRAGLPGMPLDLLEPSAGQLTPFRHLELFRQTKLFSKRPKICQSGETVSRTGENEDYFVNHDRRNCSNYLCW